MSKAQSFFNKPIKLLPTYFKKIGLGLIILCVIVPIAFKLFHFQIESAKKEMIKTITKDIVIIGMVFIAFSRDKVEDELTMLLRTKALISAVFFAFTVTIVSDVFNLFLSEPVERDDAFSIMFRIVFFQILYNQLAKLNRWP